MQMAVIIYLSFSTSSKISSLSLFSKLLSAIINLCFKDINYALYLSDEVDSIFASLIFIDSIESIGMK